MSNTRETTNQSTADNEQFSRAQACFEQDTSSFSDKLDAFGKFASRQAIAKFLTKYEIYKRILHINGSIVECGVLHGGGTLAWAKLSSILEPTNHTRRIIGFDTFQGFPSVTKEDGEKSEHTKIGGLASNKDNVTRAVSLYNMNRPLSHIPKVELVEGDICDSATKYLAKNQHLVVSLLYLDLDLYKPTKAALQAFLPRMPKGAVIVFDELNAEIFPGETQAVQEVVGLKNLKIERFSFDSYVSYAVIE